VFSGGVGKSQVYWMNRQSQEGNSEPLVQLHRRSENRK